MVFAKATELCLIGKHARAKYKALAGAGDDPGPLPCALEGLAGRVCRGAPSSATAFETLHPDGLAIKPYSWVLGEDGLRMLLDGDDSAATRLGKLGFSDFWVCKKLQDGEVFRLALFPAESAQEATWDGVLRLVDMGFPPAVCAKVHAHAEALHSTPFEQIEARAKAGYLQGASYHEVNELGHATDDARYMSVLRFAACAGSLEEARGFLYCVLSYVASSRPEASANSPSSFDTPCQRQIKLRATSSLGQPRPMGRCLLAGQSHRPCLPPIGARPLRPLRRHRLDQGALYVLFTYDAVLTRAPMPYLLCYMPVGPRRPTASAGCASTSPPTDESSRLPRFAGRSCRSLKAHSRLVKVHKVNMGR